MARVTLELPAAFAFATEMPVRLSDLNFVNHLGNVEALAMVQEARARFLASLGFSETDLGGVGFVVADAVAVYKSQAHHGDRLRFEVAAADFNRYGCDFLFRVTHLDDGREVLCAKTGIVCFDYSAGQVRPLPDAARAQLAGASTRPSP
jgi:4-hydroxybenzoyl-CoA thioesterase